jgi:hypothetical protein
MVGMVADAAESGEDAGADPAPPELPATGGADVTLETGWPGRVSYGLVGSWSFMIALLLTRQLDRDCEPFM